ncbi:hypothetical protein K493DRAFT_69924 [Basidiobolus meristosporus CBS 931.73]|uniref:F-box domain-containing protein n=1 Tax=Basidiobolus meristosporus CBS 931.73 TaxID=1314790 RepID=A0A1Y1XUC6_9FUNG|nr:hypothetical protein K493DRAFT_69924 [Basidiobolus meristosporus CBS 931.73]|eukprot:ORX89285.1 hypothetical protein K493DRAFT_69924 [Basidiobolus meristosporus CBS 931.73]
MPLSIMDPITAFPIEIVTRIFSWLDAADICQASLVSRSWRLICNQESIWQELCQRSWSNKKGVAPTLQPRADYSGDCAYRLTADELLTILELRKQEFRSESTAELVEIVQRTTPSLTKAVANFRSKWKANYAFAQTDSRRCDISIEEVCGEWVLEVGRIQKCDPIDVSFNEDYTYYSENTGQLKWDFCGKYVRIEDFPPLKPSRTSDWGWKLSCPYFDLYSK